MNSLDENSLEGKDRTLFQNMKSILSKRSKSLIPSQAKLVSSGIDTYRNISVDYWIVTVRDSSFTLQISHKDN